MRHVVLTRSAYGPEWSLDANRRRLNLTRAVTVSLMAAQTFRDWTWIILLHAQDELGAERRAVFKRADVDVRFIDWEPPEFVAMPWDRRPAADRNASLDRQRKAIAAVAYKAPWAAAVGSRDHPLLSTRLDDDDGFTPDALERVQRKAGRVVRRRVLMFPEGIRVWRGKEVRVRHETNAMHTLATPADDDLLVYDYGHRQVAEQGFPVRFIDEDPAWLWVRHDDTISGIREAVHPISSQTRRLFPIKWDVVELEPPRPMRDQTVTNARAWLGIRARRNRRP